MCRRLQQCGLIVILMALTALTWSLFGVKMHAIKETEVWETECYINQSSTDCQAYFNNISASIKCPSKLPQTTSCYLSNSSKEISEPYTQKFEAQCWTLNNKDGCVILIIEGAFGIFFSIAFLVYIGCLVYCNVDRKSRYAEIL